MFGNKKQQAAPVKLRINPEAFKTVEDLAFFLAEFMQFSGMSEQFARFMRNGSIITEAEFLKNYKDRLKL